MDPMITGGGTCPMEDTDVEEGAVSFYYKNKIVHKFWKQEEEFSKICVLNQ